MKNLLTDYKKHEGGIDDPGLALDIDPLFSGVLGTGVSRRARGVQRSAARRVAARGRVCV